MQALLSFWQQVGIMYDQELSELKLKIFAMATANYEISVLKQALIEHVKISNKQPFPADLIKIIKPSTESAIYDAVNRCFNAIETFGYSNPERAQGYIGELGWVYIEKFGGWKNFCATVTYENKSTMFAQARESMKSIHESIKKGTINTAPKLPSAGTKKINDYLDELKK